MNFYLKILHIRPKSKWDLGLLKIPVPFIVRQHVPSCKWITSVYLQGELSLACSPLSLPFSYDLHCEFWTKTVFQYGSISKRWRQGSGANRHPASLHQIHERVSKRSLASSWIPQDLRSSEHIRRWSFVHGNPLQIIWHKQGERKSWKVLFCITYLKKCKFLIFLKIKCWLQSSNFYA